MGIRDKTILVTGGAGFIGSNFICYCLENHEDYRIINFDKLTYAGNLTNLEEVSNDSRYTFVAGDICNRGHVESIFRDYDISAVIHFAAESHVDNSISSPFTFVETNVNGTATLLDVAHRNWSREKSNSEPTCHRFVHISTDEVYGSLDSDGFFTEHSQLAPNSPYSASKAGSDLLVRSYHKTYGLNVVTTRCSNNYGPKQHKEKLIPTIITRALTLSPIPIYGDGMNVRDWIYVRDHCSAIDKVFHAGQAGEIYNIGAHAEHTNLEVAKLICAALDDLAGAPPEIGSYSKLITFVTDRPGHDKRYAIDWGKMRSAFGWVPSTGFGEGIYETVRWYLNQVTSKQ